VNQVRSWFTITGLLFNTVHVLNFFSARSPVVPEWRLRLAVQTPGPQSGALAAQKPEAITAFAANARVQGVWPYTYREYAQSKLPAVEGLF